jgi:hypothetical protein
MPNFGSQMFIRAAEDHKYANLLFFHLRNKGVFLLEGFPTYMTAAHTDEDIDYCISAFRESVAELQEGGFFDVPSGITVSHLNGSRLNGPPRILTAGSDTEAIKLPRIQRNGRSGGERRKRRCRLYKRALVVQLSRCNKTEAVRIDRRRRNGFNRRELNERRQSTSNIGVVGDDLDQTVDVVAVGFFSCDIGSDIDLGAIFGHRHGFVDDHNVVVFFVDDHNNIERKQDAIGRTLGDCLIECKVRRSDCGNLSENIAKVFETKIGAESARNLGGKHPVSARGSRRRYAV